MNAAPIADLYEIPTALDWIASGIEANERDYGAGYAVKAVSERLTAIIHAMELDLHNEQGGAA
ncbi:MAG: hypothetical protein EOL86_08835 [Deltaproteobacteria bacterium]|nr:hypothetical protein [Deltaproteobacteria bacterium]